MSEQLDLVDACERRDLGIARAEQGAENAQPGWTEQAAAYLQWYARHRAAGQPFLIEDAAIVYKSPPPNLKAWGPAAMRAARQGWIVKVGYAPARTSNLSPKTLWRAAA